MQQKKPEDEGQKRKPVKKSGMGLFIPLSIGVVLFGGAAVAILGGKKEPKVEPVAAASDKPKPFADLPREQPPKRGSPSTKFVAEAPGGLSSDANWQKAVKLASEGETLFEEATAAKAAGETAELNAKGKQSRDKLNEAFDLTVVWEEELLEKYGDANAEVRRIVRTRSGWMDKIRWLHKSIAR